jgi:2-polyprenyl-3-methyl-5-hydroxy-6-metoxy-1,4-benzoquinol methylase
MGDPIWRVNAELGARLFQPHIDPSHAVVDFGCGTGGLMSKLEAASKLGVEVNDASRERAEGAGHRVVGSPEEVAPESADVVVSNHVLEHTLQPYVELRAIRAMLRPGGTLLLCVPIDDWRVQRRPVPADADNHLYAWTPRLLRNLLAEAGFAVQSIRIVTYGFPGRLTGPLARVLPHGLFDAVAVATAVLLRRRQLMAVATRPPAASQR